MPSQGSCYDPAKFGVGTMVRLASRPVLEGFLRPAWKFHHPLSADQLEYGERSAKVLSTAMYHGGDVLYTLEGVPGIWHERCLEAV
jgi:hypothetical protein